MESNNACLSAVAVPLNCVIWSLCLVDKIRIKNVELVSLHNLRRWIVMVIVGLVILVPLVTCVNAVEILGLSWSVLVMPPVHLHSMSTGRLNFFPPLKHNK